MHLPIHIIFLVFLLPSQIATFECGIPYFPFTKASNESAGHQFKISNGDRVLDNAKYPWMAAFFRNDQQCCQNMQFCYCCSASIIGPRHIILAAHCIPSKEEAVEHTQIRLGNVNYLSEEIIKPAINQIIVHPEFNSRTLDNDIAIIELANPLNFSEQIRPICLAKEFDETKYGTIGWDGAYQANMIIAGWGHQHEDYSQPDLIPEILREGMAHPIALDECKIKIGPLDEKIICMGMEMIGQKRQIAEKGDSGGPAFLWKESDNGNGRRQRRYTQVGVSSFKVSYSNKDPVAYTRISAFCDWIGESTSGEIKCI